MIGRLRHDRALVGLTSGSVLLVAYLSTGWGGPSVQVRIFWTALLFFDLLMRHFSARVAAIPALPAGARRFWRHMSRMAVLATAGDASQTVVAWLRPGPAAAVPNALQAATVLGAVCWLIWLLLTHPTPLATRAVRVRFWLDAGSVLVGALVLIWLLLLPNSGAGSAPLPLLVGSSIIAFAAFAAVKLVLSGNAPLSLLAAAPMIAAIALQGCVGTLVTDDGAHLPLLLAVQILPAVLLAIGPRLQEHCSRADPRATVHRRRRAYSLLPYTSLAGLFAALPVVLRDGAGTDVWLLLGGLAATTVLVVTRQLLAFRENAGLLEQLGAQRERFESLLVHSSDITSIVDAQGTLRYVSPAVERILGKTPESVLGSPLLSHVHPEDLAEVREALDTLRATANAHVTYQVRYAHADGSWRWLDVVTSNLLDLPSVSGYVSNARDVTQARGLQDELRHRATHDSLTGLGNRSLFDARLAAAACTGVAAVLLVDLNDFKAVNDDHGHHAGDVVLAAVAQRLAAAVPAAGTAARIGGDEFAVLLPGFTAAAAEQVAQRFLDLLGAPVQVEGHELSVRASVGIVDGDPRAAETLLRRADARLYEMKREIRSQMSSSS